MRTAGRARWCRSRGDPGDVDVRGAGAVACARRPVAGVAVVAEELDRRHERAHGPAAGRRARRVPAEVVGEPPGGGVPGRLRRAVGGGGGDGGGGARRGGGRWAGGAVAPGG